MNQENKNNPFTFIVQAQKKHGKDWFKPLKPHYFYKFEDALKFMDKYIEILKNDPLVIDCEISSSFAVCTEMPRLAYWYNKKYYENLKKNK